ncbi:MAG: 50S ribosomal protein L32e [Methanobacteriota archaeon]
MTKEDSIKAFTALKGVGKAKAESLYENGFTTIEKLRDAKVEELTKIKGVTEKNAQDIKKQLAKKKPVKTTKKTPKTDTPKEQPKAEKKPEEKEQVEIVEPSKGTYTAKKKPELSKEQRQQLLLRRKKQRKNPRFLREEWFRYKRIPMNWRRPDGITSKMRKHKGYRPHVVRVGFRGPKEVRGLHPSGFEEVMVSNVTDLTKMNPKTQAARIRSTVGTKKRADIAKKADELDIRILNMRV